MRAHGAVSRNPAGENGRSLELFPMDERVRKGLGHPFAEAVADCFHGKACLLRMNEVRPRKDRAPCRNPGRFRAAGPGAQVELFHARESQTPSLLVQEASGPRRAGGIGARTEILPLRAEPDERELLTSHVQE